MDELDPQIPQRSFLESVLSPLDWGRQAVTNFGEGFGEIGRGNYGNAFLKMGPGIVGVLAGLASGGAAAPLAAAAASSLSQGLIKQFAPKVMDSMSTQDLVRKLGGDPESTWQNIGIGAVTDPWTWAMGAGLGAKAFGRAGGVGERVGTRAGKAIGEVIEGSEPRIKNALFGLEDAAVHRGPQYAGPNVGMMLDELGPQGHRASEIADFLRQNPRAAEMVAKELPPGSLIDFPIDYGGKARFIDPHGQEVTLGTMRHSEMLPTDGVRAATAWPDVDNRVPGTLDKLLTVSHGPTSGVPVPEVVLDPQNLYTQTHPDNKFYDKIARMLGSDKRIQGRLAEGLPGYLPSRVQRLLQKDWIPKDPLSHIFDIKGLAPPSSFSDALGGIGGGFGYLGAGAAGAAATPILGAMPGVFGRS